MFLKHIIYCVLFDLTENAVDEPVQWQHCINIYLHRECCKTSFIHCFIVTAKNLICLEIFILDK